MSFFLFVFEELMIITYGFTTGWVLCSYGPDVTLITITTRIISEMLTISAPTHVFSIELSTDDHLRFYPISRYQHPLQLFFKNCAQNNYKIKG